MKRSKLMLKELKMMAEPLHYEYTKVQAIVTIKNGRQTAELHIFKAPEGGVVINIDDCVTFIFDTEAEYAGWTEKHIEVCESEKDKFQKLTGMSDADWNAWNGQEEDE